MKARLLCLLLVALLPLATPAQTTELAFTYDPAGNFELPRMVQFEYEGRVIQVMRALFPVSQSFYGTVPCKPSIQNPKKLCIEASERALPFAPNPASLGNTQWSPPSLLAQLIKSRCQAWVQDEIKRGTTPEEAGRFLGNLGVHEIGHACGVKGHYALSISTQFNFMSDPTDFEYANAWYPDEEKTIKTNCMTPTGPPPQVLRVDEFPHAHRAYNYTTTFSYPPGQDPTDLSSFWGYSDVFNFYTPAINDGFAPPDQVSTYMTMRPGATSGWATTPILPTLDRKKDAYVVKFKAYWDLHSGEPTIASNFLVTSLALFSSGTFQYRYNFYIHPRTFADAPETPDYRVMKSFTTTLGSKASGDPFTWNNEWIYYALEVDKVQAAGGTGKVKLWMRDPVQGWRLMVEAVDNSFTTFNAVDFWQQTSQTANVSVFIDHVVARIGYK